MMGNDFLDFRGNPINILTLLLIVLVVVAATVFRFVEALAVANLSFLHL